MASYPAPEEATGVFSWERTGIDRRQFYILTRLLEIKDRQQKAPSKLPAKGTESSASLGQDTHSDHDIAEFEDDSIQFGQLAHEKTADSLKQHFLDRLAEVLAREKGSASRHKTYQKRQKRKKACSEGFTKGHTAAAALLEREGSAVVIVAKNRGLDGEDRDMIKRLSIWIRVMAETGERNLPNDSFWNHMLRFCRARLSFYIQEISGVARDLGLVENASIMDQPKNEWIRLVALCDTLQNQDPESLEIRSLSDLACLAYQIRSSSITIALPQLILTKAKALEKNVALLGRYRAAYETFRKAAMHFSAFRNLEIQSIDLINLENIPLDLPFLTGTLRKLRLEGLSFGSKHTAQSLLRDCQAHRSYHAEVQLLVDLEKRTQSEPSVDVFPYLGISKKSCFLCGELLSSFPYYRTRGSHGKVYSLWDIPEISGLNTHFLFQLEAALIKTRNQLEVSVEKAFHDKKKVKLPLVPESTAGISTETGSNSVQRRLRHRAKVENRLNLGQDDAEKPFRPEFEPYGPELWHVLAALLPGKGGEPSLVKVPIVGIPDDYHADDSFCGVTPCLNEFWGLRDRDKSMLQFEATNQAIATTNGLYYIYWTADDNADPNEFLLKLLHEIVPELPIHRRFWCGHVFIFRVNNGQSGYEFRFVDIAEEFLGARQLMSTIFKHYFKITHLEEKVNDDAYFAELDQDRERAKTLIFERMTPEEKQLLKRYPPNMLDYLMMRPGKYAYDWIPMGIRPCPEDPSRVLIEGYHVPTTLEQMDWQGFESSQL
ncbi:hypothetical protein G7Y79_00017g041890 [Physcia stellaris]|nr:hypothetical protein G7Y79_00017g041890 [Physcia stellaris]